MKVRNSVKLITTSLVLLVLLPTLALSDIVGDTIEASLTIDPNDTFFDENAITGTSVVVDPGREFQGEVYDIPNGTNIDAYIDINDSELTIGMVRTDSSNGNFEAGAGRLVTFLIWDIEWTGSQIQADYQGQFTFGASNWEGNPADYVVTTTATSIQIDVPSMYALGGNGGEISATWSISAASIPEPASSMLIGVWMVACLIRRERTLAL